MINWFTKKTLFLKTVVVAVATQFILTSVPAFAYKNLDQLRPKSTAEALDGGVIQEIQRGLIDNLVTPNIKIFAENVKVGGKTVKEQEKKVDQAMQLTQLVEQKFSGALLDHSATREDCILEITKDVMAGFNTAGLDRNRALAEIEKIAANRATHATDLFGEGVVTWQLWNTLLSNAMKEFLDVAPTISRDKFLTEAKKIAEVRFNEVINHRIKALLAEGVKDIPVCVGSSKATMDEIKKDVIEQLNGIFNGIIGEKQFQEAMENGVIFYVPNEPPGKIGTGKADDPENIRAVHQAIYNWLEEKYGKENAKSVWGRSFLMMYGASVDADNVDGIMAVKSTRPDMEGTPLCHGVLFATYGKEVEKYLKVAQGVARAAERDDKKYVTFINLKHFAKNEKTPPEKYIKAIYEAVTRGDIDATRTAFYIADTDNNLNDWQSALTKVNSEFLLTTNAFWLSELFYPGVVDAKKTEVIGSGYIKETLTFESKAGDFINSKLKPLFKDDAKEGDVYVFLKKEGKIFALGRENKKDQTLTTVSTADLSDAVAKAEYYSKLLEFTSKMTQKTGEFIELIEQDGERLKRFISKEPQPKSLDSNPVAAFKEEFSLGGRIKGVKYWFGGKGGKKDFSQKFFQMEYRSNNAPSDSRPTLITFKRSHREISRGLSLLVQPKTVTLINGAGTVGYRIADAFRKNGIFVEGITVGNWKSAEKTRDAFFRRGYTLYFYTSEESEKFASAGIKVVGTLEEILDSGKIDYVIDGSPEKGVENKKIYDKYVKVGKIKGVVFQGGEEADIAPSSFSSATNYNEAIGKQYVRVVSCNTTALARTFAQVLKKFKDVVATIPLLRRIKDPVPGKGDVDTAIAEKGLSHHAPDLLTVIPDELKKNIKDLETIAIKIPTTHFHMHIVPIEAPGITAEKVSEILKAQSRIGLVDFKKEIDQLRLYQILQEYLNVNDSFMAAAVVVPSIDEKGKTKENKVILYLLVDQQSIAVPENVDVIRAMSGLSKDADTSIRLTNEAMGIDDIKEGLETDAPAKLTKKPSVPKEELKLPIDVFTESDVTIPATIAVRDDLNSSKDTEGKIMLGSKLLNGAKVYSKDAEKNNKVVGLSHQGRKKDGQGDKDFTEELDQHAKIMSRLTGKIINYVSDLFGDAAINAISKMKSGDILQLKNARSWETETNEKMSPEEHSKTPLIQNLSKVIDYVKFTNLAILHRYNVTIDGWPEDMPIILGDKVIKDIVNIENVRQILLKSQPCLFIAGGAKIDDYLVLVDKGLESNILAEVKTGGLFGELCLLAQGYKLGKPTMKILEKQFKKFESEKEGYGTGLDAMVKEIKDLLVKYQGRIDVPVDVAFINKDGKRQVVAVEEKHKNEAITDDYEIRDIGDATADKYVKDIDKAKGVLIKGPLGDVNKKETAVGSDKAYKAVREKQIKDPDFSSVLGGGDAGTTFDQLNIKKDKFSVVVDAGGALIVYLAEGPKGLPGLVAAERSKKYILEKAKALNVDTKALLNFTIASKKIFKAVGGLEFSDYIDRVRNSQQQPVEQRAPRALIIGPNFFKMGGATNALVKATELLGKGFKIGLYGENAGRLEILLGKNENIETANTLDALISKLSDKGITPNNIVLLRSPEDNLDGGTVKKLSELGVKQVVAPDISTIGLTKAIEVVIPTKEVKKASEDFYAKAAEQDIISKETYAKNKDLLLAELKAGETIKLSEELTLTQKVAEEIKQDKLTSEAFMAEI